MNIENLFDYCLDNNETQNKTIYFIGDIIENSIFTISIDNNTDKIYSYSNEWLYLLKPLYYPSNTCIYDNLITYYNTIINNKNLNYSYAELNVIPLITSFSKGTLHGYTGLFFMLNEYINNINNYNNYYILVYLDSQQGLLDIINHFVDINIINKEQIIYISSNVQYLFNSIKFIPNEWHAYPLNLNIELVDKYMIKQNNYLPLENDKVCIIKSSLSDNRTSCGIINEEVINLFCIKNNLYFLEPTKMNEIELINRIYNTKIFVASWGTAYMKNIVYISNMCEKVIVFIIGDDFINQYNSTKHYMSTKYKNAIISYHIVDTELNINLDEII